MTTADLRYASSTIQADLDRFQRGKVSDLRAMSLAFCAFHREWAVKVRCLVTTVYRPRRAPAAEHGPVGAGAVGDSEVGVGCRVIDGVVNRSRALWRTLELTLYDRPTRSFDVTLELVLSILSSDVRSVARAHHARVG